MKTIGTTMKMIRDWKTYPELIRMNELDAAIHIPWDELLKWIATGIFAALLWMLKQFGHQHIASVKELAVELREMRKEINSLSERVKIVEVVQQHYHHE